MKELDKKDAPEVSGGVFVTPYPVGATTPPYVPPPPGSDCEPLPDEPLQNVIN